MNKTRKQGQYPCFLVLFHTICNSFFSLGLLPSYFTKNAIHIDLESRISKGCMRMVKVILMPSHQNILLSCSEMPMVQSQMIKLSALNNTDKA